MSPEVNDGPCWLYAVSSDGLNRWKWVETAGKRVETTGLRVEKETLAGLQLYSKENLTQVFSCEICEIFKSIYFYRTPSAAASGSWKLDEKGIHRNVQKINSQK